MELIALLQSLLGENRVSQDADELLRRSNDTWPLRLVQHAVGASPNCPICVVKPRSTEEVSTVLRVLHAQGVHVIPYGGGSGVHGGAEANRQSVILDLAEMNQILDLDEQNLMVCSQAGVFLRHLENYLNERGYTTGHYPQSIDLAQMGGLVATRSAGQFSTKYGNIEDLVIGLEAVLPTGEIVRIRNVPRRAVGPDLRHIWIGSEGTFGIITEVTVKIFATPAERWMNAYAIAEMSQGLEIISQFMRAGWKPAVVRLHDAIEAERKYSEFLNRGESILLLLSEGPLGYANLEGSALNQIIVAGGGRPLGPKPVEHWLVHRNDVHELKQLTSQGLIVDTIEIAAGWTDIATLYVKVTQRLRKEVPELLVVTGHSSHSYAQGTNLYFILAANPPRDPEEVARVYWSIWSKVMETTLEHHGTICHHHGIGKLRAPWVAKDLGSSYLLLQKLKHCMDPDGMMNSGTLLPDAKTQIQA